MTEIDVLTATASELQSLLSSGATTSEALTVLYLDQITKHNHFGMRLNAIISVLPREDALKRARELDDERKATGPRGPLHGIPVIFKDLHCTPSVGLPTTAGSVALLGTTAKQDSGTVRRMMEAGALIIAKANLSEFGYLKGKGLAGAWSAVGGQTQCPYIRGGLRHDDLATVGVGNPSGSSSGSAVAVAAGFCPLSVGDEMEGSLTSPATRNALYTLKPTPGSTPADGVFNPAPGMTSSGVFAKSVRDLIDGTAVLTGKSFDEDVISKGWKGLTIGVLEDKGWMARQSFLPRSEEVDRLANAALDECLAKIASEGATVKRNIYLPRPEAVLEGFSSPTHSLLGQASLRTGVDEYLANFTLPGAPPDRRLTINDVIAINASPTWSPIALPPDYPRQDALEEAATFEWPASSPMSHHDTLQAMFKGMRAGFDDAGVDVIVADADYMLMTAAALSEAPLAAAPLGGLEEGACSGRRTGVCVLGRKGADEVVLRVCMAWEASFPRAREAPRMLRNWDDFVAGKKNLW